MLRFVKNEQRSRSDRLDLNAASQIQGCRKVSGKIVAEPAFVRANRLFSPADVIMIGKFLIISLPNSRPDAPKEFFFHARDWEFDDSTQIVFVIDHAIVSSQMGAVLFRVCQPGVRIGRVTAHADILAGVKLPANVAGIPVKERFGRHMRIKSQSHFNASRKQTGPAYRARDPRLKLERHTVARLPATRCQMMEITAKTRSR